MQAIPPESNAHMPSCACYIEEVEVSLFFGRHIECGLLKVSEAGTLCCLYEAIEGPQSVAKEAIPVDVATRDAPTRLCGRKSRAERKRVPYTGPTSLYGWPFVKGGARLNLAVGCR